MKDVEMASKLASNTPVTDREVWLLAGLMLQEFGSQAVITASQRADEALDKANLDGQRLWRRVVRAITAITETEGETLH